MNTQVNGLKALIEKHVSTLQSEGAIAIDSIKQIPPDIQAGKDAAHKVKGSSGSCGFSELSECALILEKHLLGLINNNDPISQETLDIGERLEKILTELSPEKSSLYNL